MIDKERFLAVGEKEAATQAELLQEATEATALNTQFLITQRNEEQGK